MKLANLFSRVKPAIEKSRTFAASEAFDVVMFFVGILLLVAGCCLLFGAAVALVVAGALFVLSIKPLARWIQ